MRTLSWVLIITICFVSGGATCMQRNVALPFPPPPPVFAEQTPTIQELAAVVNRTSAITQLASNSASVDVLTMPGLPELSATISLQREKRFRLKASLPIAFGGLDMGSNEQVFWFEVPERMTRTLYFAEHEKYQQQLHRAVLPVDPTWIMDALGLSQIDPNTVVAGPVKRADGKLEIRNTITMPSGVFQRVLFLDPSAGFVTNQFLYEPSGRLIATSEATNHRYYEQYQCSLPHQVVLNLTPSSGPPLSMEIRVGSYVVNQLLSGDPALFVMPQTAKQKIDLTTVTSVPSAVVAPVGYTAEGISPTPLRGMLR